MGGPAGRVQNLDGSRLAAAGDSVGGNMSAALTLMAKERGDVPLLPVLAQAPLAIQACRIERKAGNRLA